MKLTLLEDNFAGAEPNFKTGYGFSLLIEMENTNVLFDPNNNYKPYKIYPIGFVKNQLARGHKFGFKGSRHEISKIELFKSQEPFLYGLKDEKWITVVYFFHKQRQIRSVFSRGLDGKKVGIFASRTPERLSRIGITNVELIKIENTILFVKNLDAIDGTPVLDIKLGEKSRW